MQRKELMETQDIFGLQDIQPQEDLHEASAAEEEAFSITDSVGLRSRDERAHTRFANDLAHNEYKSPYTAHQKTFGTDEHMASGPPLPSGHVRHRSIAKDTLLSGTKI
ncbi:hypothetical protein NDU88_000910 [Pleurodeles waltl]|uniref:Uncharacterized protein n=1 Tax=Pleurodeles waltl TaxID=8319 RepID=A0AAV7Q8A0_PLEWA|nr:hypothetical protein NDU88_000910 [Pleurodeles waltl]